MPEGETFPTSFLAADDVDSYIHDVDASLGQSLPSLAPRAHDSSLQAHLKNPTSVTNWLRKHAPKIFLQDAEHDDEDAGHAASGSGRRGRGARGERGRGRGRGRGRASNVSERPTSSAADLDASMDDELDAPVRGKRKRDDDPGYRPGGSARPVKKKRKSDVEGRKGSKKDVTDV